MTTSPTAGPDEEVQPDGEGRIADGASGSAAEDRVLELEDHLRRSLADFDNLRKRFDREVVRERSAERSLAAATWLPIIDDLALALEHAEADPESLRFGVSSIRDQAVNALTRLGFDRFDAVGERFDPVRHEAMGTVASAGPSGVVIAELRPGYASGESVLRAAGVMVSREADG